MIYIYLQTVSQTVKNHQLISFFFFFFSTYLSFSVKLCLRRLSSYQENIHMKKSGALYAKVKKQPWKRQANQTNAWNKKYMCISSNYGYKSFNLKPEYLWCLCPLHIWKLKKPYTDLTILQSTIKIPCQAIFKNGSRTSILTVNMWKSHNYVTCK